MCVEVLDSYISVLFTPTLADILALEINDILGKNIKIVFFCRCLCKNNKHICIRRKF